MKVRQRLTGETVRAAVTNEIVDPSHLGRVSCDRDGSESKVLDQSFRQLCSRAKQLVRAVRSDTEQRQAGFADQLEQRVIIAGFTVDQWL